MYDFKILTPKKVLLVEVKGMLDYAEAENVISDYKKRISNLKAEEYTLILNGKDVHVSSLFVAPLIQQFIMLCYNTPFKRFYFVGNQLQNSYASSLIASNNSMGRDIRLINSVDEALKQL